MFDRSKFETACNQVCDGYEKASPFVSRWADRLRQAKDHEITVADLSLLGRIADEKPSGYAAGKLIHQHQAMLGR